MFGLVPFQFGTFRTWTNPIGKFRNRSALAFSFTFGRGGNTRTWTWEGNYFYFLVLESHPAVVVVEPPLVLLFISLLHELIMKLHFDSLAYFEFLL